MRNDKTGNRRIAETTLPNGKWVSTVSMDFGVPGVDTVASLGYAFETMVFESGIPLGAELDQERYQARDEAVAGHAAMVEKWSRPPTGKVEP